MRKTDIQGSFERFHREHPEVYRLFKQFAFELKEAGRRSYGAKSIMERIRWHYATTGTDDGFKINNNYTSRYVRLFVAEHPDFVSFFETRRLQTS